MGWFTRKTRDTDEPPANLPQPPSRWGEGEADEVFDVEATDGRPTTRPLTGEERARVEAAVSRAQEQGIDLDDLASIGAFFDAAFRRWQSDPGAESSDVIVDTAAMAIGEHLARHSARGWVVATDIFGTDLGLVAAKADTVIVPHNLVGARWMRGETEWIPGVIGHLVRMQPRRA